MEIQPCGSAPSRRLPADWFTGTVWQDPIIERQSRPWLEKVTDEQYQAA